MKSWKRIATNISSFLFAKRDKIVNMEEENIPKIAEKREKLNKELANIQVGTIIWAKRLNFRCQNENMEYKISPYLVIGKTEYDLICMRGTSFAPDEKRKRIYFDAGVVAYDKHSFFRLYNLEYIENERYVSIFSRLSDESLRELFFLSKRLNEQDLYDILSANNDLYKLIRVGDIIKYYNKIMYVCSLENDQLLCIPINDYEITKSNVKFSVCNLDFENALCVTRNERMELLSQVNVNKTKTIIQNFKNVIKSLCDQSLMQSEETYEDMEMIMTSEQTNREEKSNVSKKKKNNVYN